jgi:hypothetical protein
MKIVVITAFWGRFPTVKVVLEHLVEQRHRLVDTVNLIPLTIGSEGSRSRELAESCGAAYVEFPNEPLGNKWQYGLTCARTLDPDAVMTLGSDNMANDALFVQWVQALRDGIDYTGIYDHYQFNPHYWTLVHWPGYKGPREGEPIGSGRCYSRELLSKLDWQLWDRELSNSLDYSATQHLKTVTHKDRFTCMRHTDLKHLGIKLHQTLSSPLQFENNVEHFDPRVLIDWFGTELGHKILDLKNHNPEEPYRPKA